MCFGIRREVLSLEWLWLQVGDQPCAAGDRVGAELDSQGQRGLAIDVEGRLKTKWARNLPRF